LHEEKKRKKGPKYIITHWKVDSIVTHRVALAAVLPLGAEVRAYNFKHEPHTGIQRMVRAPNISERVLRNFAIHNLKEMLSGSISQVHMEVAWA
jgi:hypothetical protein